MPHKAHIESKTEQDDDGNWTLCESELEKLPKEARQRTRHLLQVLQVTRMCNKATDLDSAISSLVQSTCNILDCDRATLFMVDNSSEELVVRSAVGIEGFRIPWTEGIVGSVFTSGQTVSVRDAYQDNRFSKIVDSKTGYRTKSVLCVPVKDDSNTTIAVLEALNKTSNVGHFGSEEKHLLEYLADQVGVVLQNQLQKEEIKKAHYQVLAMLDIVKSLHSDIGIASQLFTITERSPELVNAERCTIYLVDRNHGELLSMQGAVEIRMSVNSGLAGYSAVTGTIVNIQDAHLDKRFDSDMDNKTGFRTRSVLVMPIFERTSEDTNSSKVLTSDVVTHSTHHSSTSTNPEIASASGTVAISAAKGVIGVIQLINKCDGKMFSSEDCDRVSLFLDIVGPLLSQSHLFHAPKLTTEFGAAADIVPCHPPKPGHLQNRQTSSSSLLQASTIVEEDEDEGCED